MIISYNLYDAITQMKPTKGLELKMASEWLLSPPLSNIPKTAIFQKDDFKEIEKITSALKRRRKK